MTGSRAAGRFPEPRPTAQTPAGSAGVGTEQLAFDRLVIPQRVMLKRRRVQ